MIVPPQDLKIIQELKMSESEAEDFVERVGICLHQGDMCERSAQSIARQQILIKRGER